MAGLNVTARPVSSTAVHCTKDGHATPNGVLLSASILMVVAGVRGLVGLNVSALPESSTAVHCTKDGQATAFSRPWVDLT